MTKRLPTILTIIASVLFLIVTVLIGSDLGGNFYYLWAEFEVLDFLKTVVIVSAAGLLLGAFLFHKKRFTERIKLTIPIAFIIFSCYECYRLVNYYYGRYEYYNAQRAKKDIKEGNVQLLYAGLDLSMDSEKIRKAKDSIRVEFGLKFLNVGIHTKGLERYNEVVESYLAEKNGKNWEKKLKFKLDSLEQADKE
jgi:hypothetical protein